MVSTRASSRPPNDPLPEPTMVPLANGDSSDTNPFDEKPISSNMTTTLSNHHDSIIQTPAGDIKVRPFRSSSNAQLKAILSFEPRVSSLDRNNTKSQTDEFRGFFTLFWIGLALLFARTSMQHWEENRTPLSWTFGRLITGDALVLAIADGLMVATMFFCVPFVKALQYGWIRYYWTGVVLQHTFQTLYLAIAIWWGYHRQWFWVQSGFLVLHCLSMLMKMHSYMAHNGMLATVYFRMKRELSELDNLLSSLPGGREAVLQEAATRQASLEADNASSAGNTPLGTPGSINRDLSPPGAVPSATMTPRRGAGLTSYEVPAEALHGQLDKTKNMTLEIGNGKSDTSASPSSGQRKQSGEHLAPAVELRRRKGSNGKKMSTAASNALPAPESGLPHGTSLEPSASTTPHAPRAPNPLSWSSNERVAVLARNIDAMKDELKSNGARGLVWPENVTFMHFADYLLIPTLVYQLEYPRTKTMNPLIVLEKIVATFGTFSLIYLITEHYISPSLPVPGDSIVKAFVNLALPMMINYLLIFYIIFECVCTGFAELSYFADREFYQDWWNSTTWDQFSRKWNKPVHTFLLRHVYASTMDGLQLSKNSAALFTFFLSALCHELGMAVVTKKIRPYLFLMQMAQVPMIALGKVPIVRRNKTMGNIVFWCGLMCGFPLLAIGYLVY